MRVLHVTPSLGAAYGGPTRSLRAFVLASALAGIDTHVYSPDSPDEPIKGATVRVFGSRGRGSRVWSGGLLRAVWRCAAEFDIVQVHGLMNPVSSLALRIAQVRGVPVVLRPFGTMSRYSAVHRRAGLKEAYFRFWERPALRRVAAFHFTSDQERDEACWHEPTLPARAHVIPPPIAPVSLPSPAVPWNNRAPIVLVLARLHPVKDVELVIDAWPRVAAAVPGARLVIAGDGDAAYVESLRARASTYEHGTSIAFAGHVDQEDKASLLARARVLALTSHHENFGVSVAEGIGAGLPVVVTEEVQLAPFIRARDLGIVVDRTPEATATALTRLLTDASLGTRAAVDGPASIWAAFSAEATAHKLMAMYEQALGQKPPLAI